MPIAVTSFGHTRTAIAQLWKAGAIALALHWGDRMALDGMGDRTTTKCAGARAFLISALIFNVSI